MKTNICTLTERGQVSVPSDLRKAMGLRPGQKLRWEQVSETELRICLEKSGKADPRKALGYGHKVLGQPCRTTEAWMRELREGEQ
ncbi:MAG: AbrB/MazE/SpoVT family DNA-binding domain-containing protein [Opitutales bacterium]